MVKALYNKYRVDFQMFDYDISEFIKYDSQSTGFVPDIIEAPVENTEEEAEDEEEETETKNKGSDKPTEETLVIKVIPKFKTC